MALSAGKKRKRRTKEADRSWRPRRDDVEDEDELNFEKPINTNKRGSQSNTSQRKKSTKRSYSNNNYKKKPKKKEEYCEEEDGFVVADKESIESDEDFQLDAQEDDEDEEALIIEDSNQYGSSIEEGEGNAEQSLPLGLSSSVLKEIGSTSHPLSSTSVHGGHNQMSTFYQYDDLLKEEGDEDKTIAMTAYKLPETGSQQCPPTLQDNATNKRRKTEEKENTNENQQEPSRPFMGLLRRMVPSWFRGSSDPIKQQTPNTDTTDDNKKEASVSKATSQSQGSSSSPAPTQIVTSNNVLDEMPDFQRRRIPIGDLSMMDKISSGAFGDVYRAEWRGSIVAVKMFKKMTLNTFPMFRKEVNILAQLHHPNVVLYMGHVNETERVGIVMEYIKGNLYDLLHKSNKKMEFELIIHLAKQIAMGLNYLHLSQPKIIHRDLKPQNLLVNQFNHIKIADFGISREKSSTMTGFTGTPSYMAPEVIIAQRHYDEKVDVYSFGMILWEMISGKVPFKGLHPVQIAFKIGRGERPSIPSDSPSKFTSLILQCWHQEPEKRPNFTDVLKQLDAIIGT